MTSTGARLVAWVRRHLFLVVTTVATVALIAFMVVATFRLYDERQARLDAVEDLADANRQLGVEQCQGINGINATVRFVLDSGLRNRPPGSPAITDATRRLYVDTYRRLPATDCVTGAKTYFDPPFPD